MSCKYNYQIDMSGQTSHSLILERITRGSEVLEMGPATGYMTRYLQEELSCAVTCIEIDPVAAATASQFSVKMIVADLDGLEWPEELKGKSFDHILFADVLEHLKNPWQVVQAAVQLLKPAGTMLVSVPNIGHSAVLMELLAGRFDYRATGLLDDSHLRFFTRKSLLNLLEQAGMRPVELTATTTAPEDTEFGQSYHSLARPLQELLQNREDADVYQYVVMAKRQEATAPEECLRDLIVKSAPGCKDFMQIYWPDKGFAETRSVTAPVRELQEFQDCEVLLPEGAGTGGTLRFDPVNFPAYVQIKNIELLSWDKAKAAPDQVLAGWSPATGFADLNLGEGILRINDPACLKLFCTGDDPQVTLYNLPQFKQKAALRVRMRIARNWLQAAQREIHTLQAERTNLSQLLADRTAELKGLRQLLDCKAAELDDLTGALEKSRAELLEMNTSLEYSQAEIEGLNTALENSAAELKSLRAKAADYEQQLARIKSTFAWRAASGFKKIIRRSLMPLKRLRDLLPGGYKQTLIPLNHLLALPDKGPGFWQAVDKDPQFLLSGPFPAGWSEIRFQAAAAVPLKVRIYFDRGRGFNENESLALGVVCSENLHDCRCIILLGNDIRQIRLDPGEAEGRFTFASCTIAGITRFEILLRAFRLFFQRQGYSWYSIKLWLLQIGTSIIRGGPKGLWRWAKRIITPQDDYDLWLNHHTLTEADKKILKAECAKLAYKPQFSILLPVYNVDERWLRSCLDSVLGQVYPNWELCIADDASTNDRVPKVLQEYAAKDARIKVVFRKKNGHISAASNSALELATGQYIGLLDHDDVLAADALYENALLLNRHPDADMIYSDEDKIGEDGVRHSPFFKPDWSPDNLLGQMYTCHFGVYRTSIVRKLGGFRTGFEGSQDHDLALRVTEKTDKIYHIPKILYHWRTIAESTAAGAGAKHYTTSAGLKAVGEALQRRGEGGWAEALEHYPGHYLVHYPLQRRPLISIVIPTRDMARLLEKCLESIFHKTTYANYEVLVIDNGSVKPDIHHLFAKWRQREPERFRVMYLDIPFNYSRLNNEAVKQARGELLVLLNNDVEIITPNWLEEMAGQAMRPSIGTVGAKLLYADQTIQHAGVTLGIGGVGDHSHRGYGPEEVGYFGRLLIVADYAAVTGACLMVRKELFTQVGGLEEKLTVAFNDVDFCLKLLAKGFYNVVLPQVKLYHFESKSRGYENTPEKMERFLDEVNFMKQRWGNLLKHDPFYNPNLTLDRQDFSLGMAFR